MSDERAASTGRGDRGDSGRRLSGLYAPFIEQLDITGVSISVFDDAGRQSTICASDDLAARLDELQFELGEGPHWHALRTGEPVLVAALTNEPDANWPIFDAAVRDLPVGAIYAFPMFMGAVTVGVIDLYRSNPGVMDARDITLATTLTHRVARGAVQEALHSATDDSIVDVPSAPAMRREVHQATGMILVQLGITATEAFHRLRAYAYANDRAVQEVARDVVTRRLDFSDLPE
ncbi:MAG: ANTAR domain-containing protein [Salinibacterium sp.]|nr:MAG: ANTAR domain-containing protein [Salinibacterium sp.]